MIEFCDCFAREIGVRMIVYRNKQVTFQGNRITSGFTVINEFTRKMVATAWLLGQ
jgi:hypothetical protein